MGQEKKKKLPKWRCTSKFGVITHEWGSVRNSELSCGQTVFLKGWRVWVLGFSPLKYLWENWPLCKYPHQLSLTDLFSGTHQMSEQEACFSVRVECPTAHLTDVSVPQHLLRAPLGWQGSPSSFALGGTCSPGILLLGLLQSEAVSPAGIAQLFICHFTPVEDGGKSPHFCKPLFKYRVMTHCSNAQCSFFMRHTGSR